MFLAYFTVLQTDVDRWEGPSLDADAQLRFGVCSPGVGSSWLGRWMGRGSRRCSTLRRISLITFGQIFDEGVQKSVNVESLGPELYRTGLTFSHFLFVDSFKMQGRALGLSAMRETLVPRVLVTPPPDDGSLSSIAISTNPPGKSTQMSLHRRRTAL